MPSTRADWERFRGLLAPDAVYAETGTGRRVEGADAYVALVQGWKRAPRCPRHDPRGDRRPRHRRTGDPLGGHAHGPAAGAGRNPRAIRSADAQVLRWAYAGHPPALWLDDGQELTALRQGTALGLGANLGCAEGSRSTGGAGVLLYTDGLTEARHDGELFGLDRVSAELGGLHKPSPTEAVAVLRARVADYAYGTLTDDLCLLAARIT